MTARCRSTYWRQTAYTLEILLPEIREVGNLARLEEEARHELNGFESTQKTPPGSVLYLAIELPISGVLCTTNRRTRARKVSHVPVIRPSPAVFRSGLGLVSIRFRHL